MKIKVKILSKCSYCNGQAYLPAGETVDTKGERYMRFPFYMIVYLPPILIIIKCTCIQKK